MSRMLCKCGATMGTSVTPSQYNLSIYYHQEIQAAIAENPQILLSDFLTDWDEVNGTQKEFMKRPEQVEYWYCPKCQRVYETQAQIGGHRLRVYQREMQPSQNFLPEGWTRVYVLKEVATDAALEESPQMLLSAYIETYETICYLLSPDEKTVVAISSENQKVLFSYILEEAAEG